jgi:16S rRNA (cytidine1402-2'-O)-methyltransferase
MATGKLYLLPTTLGSEGTSHVIPADVIAIAKDLRFFAVEDLKSARRYLRKLDREFPIDESTFYILNKKTPHENLNQFLKIVREGQNMAILSEAGCPGIADPGGNLVALAHQQNIHVLPLVGPSSILLTLIGSGFNGQEFAFHGYLPRERKERIRKLKEFEISARKTGMTHLFMDTPFRNMHILEDLLNELMDETYLCIASNLTCYDERIKSMRIVDWRENAYDFGKIPAMFAIGKLA